MADHDPSFKSVSDLLDLLGIPTLLTMAAGVWHSIRKVVVHSEKISALEIRVTNVEEDVKPLSERIGIMEARGKDTNEKVSQLHERFYNAD